MPNIKFILVYSSLLKVKALGPQVFVRDDERVDEMSIYQFLVAVCQFASFGPVLDLSLIHI